MILEMVLTIQATPTSSASRTVFTPPPPSGSDTILAIVAIGFALAAAVVGYRIIRGGRGL
jgi:hypothetical protein